MKYEIIPKIDRRLSKQDQEGKHKYFDLVTLLLIAHATGQVVHFELDEGEFFEKSSIAMHLFVRTKRMIHGPFWLIVKPIQADFYDKVSQKAGKPKFLKRVYDLWAKPALQHNRWLDEAHFVEDPRFFGERRREQRFPLELYPEDLKP